MTNRESDVTRLTILALLLILAASILSTSPLLWNAR